MKFKEINSIERARDQIRSLEDRIETSRMMIEIIERDERNEGFRKHLISIRNRRIGQLKRQIKHYIADIQNMEKINKLSNEKVY